MAVAYFDWQRGKPGAPYTKHSPNLWELLQYMNERWNVLNLGIYSPWWNASGTSAFPSSHMFGAAYDCRYGWHSGVFRGDGPEICQWLLDNYDVLGVQMVIDYKNRRIWKSDRMAWKAHPTLQGGGDTRFHIETSKEDWWNQVPVADRLGAAPPAPTPPPVVPPPAVLPASVRRGDRNCTVALLQQKLGITVDGWFGPATELAVRAYQKANGLTVDGWVGPKTWGRLLS